MIILENKVYIMDGQKTLISFKLSSENLLFDKIYSSIHCLCVTVVPTCTP